MEIKFTEIERRFARLALGQRFAICEEMLTQLQPGSSPETAARNTIARIAEDDLPRLVALITAAEDAGDS